MGAASEHIAAAWFLRRGQQVFWPACQQGAVDFVADFQAEGLKKVQVKTATWNRSSPPWAYLQCRTQLTNKGQALLPADLYDLLVIVAPDGRRLWSIPAPLIKSTNLCLDGTRPGRKPSPWAAFQHEL
ncbi:group I intron-associated PD-(D/E)XK endonuclease [Xylophilus sp.]|uniref:group I intron-associated PD-(D/E)XK endonuclease n=1 Tax=Xylophilus sp. TaxID=2653893 RepID=UPI002D80106F|nr:group I intron-associated PD-(D/E)XK endonuclease [Xylophilus sp.]